MATMPPSRMRLKLFGKVRRRGRCFALLATPVNMVGISASLHSQGAVEPNCFAIQYHVPAEVLHERCILGWSAKAPLGTVR
jgi:hypothetical protein